MEIHFRLLVLVLSALLSIGVDAANAKSKPSSSFKESQIALNKYHDYIFEQLNDSTSKLTFVENKIKELESLFEDRITKLETKLKASLTRQISRTPHMEDLEMKVNELKSRTRNVAYESWYSYVEKSPDSANMDIIKNMKFNKKEKSSDLKIEFYTNFGLEGVQYNYDRMCTKYQVLVNGQNCASPIDATIFMETAKSNTEFIIPSTMVGICHGIPSGAVAIQIRTTKCEEARFALHTITGWRMNSRIIVEELFN